MTTPTTTGAINVLDDEAMQMLTVAATLPQPFDPELLAQVLRAGIRQLADQLARLCHHGLLRIEGARLAFRDAATRQSLLEDVSPARRALLLTHARQAQAILDAKARHPSYQGMVHIDLTYYERNRRAS
jgi:hypothetical protein